MGRTSTARERILASAAQLFHDRGYTAVGVSDLCAAASVQKGSFYHFFGSKQELALEVIDAVWKNQQAFLRRHLQGEDPPLERLKSFFDALTDQQQLAWNVSHCQRGCPLGNLASEMSTQDEVLRRKLDQIFREQIAEFRGVLEDALGTGDLPAGADTATLAESLVALLYGRLTLAKARNDVETLRPLWFDVVRLIS